MRPALAEKTDSRSIERALQRRAGVYRAGPDRGGPPGARWYPSPPMAKRTRFESRQTGRRPAANRIVRRDPSKPKRAVAPAVAEAVIVEPAGTFDESGAPASASTRGLSQAEIERAAQLEAELTSQERAIAAATRARAEAEPTRGHGTVDLNAPLAVRASKEYAYVARDVRRIALTGGLMIAILAVIDVLVNVLGIVKL